MKLTNIFTPCLIISSILCTLFNYSLAFSNNSFPLVYRYVNSIAISPDYRQDQTVFATVMKGGLFRSRDGGESWESIGQGLPKDNLRKIIISPNYKTDRTLFALSAIMSDNSTNYLYKSTDGGVTWIEILQCYGLFTFEVSPNYATDETIIAGAHYGQIFLSKNSGQTWTQLSQSIFRPKAFVFSPNYETDSTIFCGNFNNWSEGEAVFKTRNSGLSWERIIFYPIYSVNCIAVSPEYTIDETVFAGTGQAGFWKSSNTGYDWASSNIGLESNNIGTIAISPNYSVDRSIYITTSRGLFKSQDAGISWTKMNHSINNVNIETLKISPNFSVDSTLFIGTHDGIFKSMNGGSNWYESNEGILLTDFVNVSRDNDVISTLPSVVADNEGYTHVAYWGTYDSSEAPDGVTTDVFYTNNRNGSFFKPQKITVPSGYGWYSKGLDLAVDDHGNAHIAFRRSEDQIWLTTNDDIFYFTNKSGTWDYEIVIEGGTKGIAGPNAPVLGVDGFGDVHLIFDSFGYYYWKKSSNGEITGPQKVISDNHGVSTHSIFVESNGSVHFVYNAKSSVGDAMFGDLNYRVKRGDSFSEPLVIAYGMEANPTLDVDQTGKVHIAFHTSSNIYYTCTCEADSFITPIIVGSPSYQAAEAIVKEFQGNIYIADQGGKFYYKSNNEFTQQNILETDLPIIGGKTFFDVSNDGKANLVYHGSSNRIYGSLENDIYFLSFLVEACYDQINPSKIFDLSIAVIDSHSIILNWTATGDDSISGIASEYDIRYQTKVPSPDTILWWQTAKRIHHSVTPSATGKKDSVIVSDLSSDSTYYFAMKVGDDAGNWSDISNIVYTIIPTMVKNANIIHDVFSLFQNYPNPFNPMTTIKYQLPKECHVTLKVFNALGQEITTLVNERKEPGLYSTQWDAAGQASGLYFIYIKAEGFSKVQKMLLIQ